MPTELETADSQEEILLTLVQGEEGEKWASGVSGWTNTSTYNACYWDFIICDQLTTQDVVQIQIEGKNLIGTIPSELALLHELVDISLPSNSLTGTVPEEITKLKHLTVVNLENNTLSGAVPFFTTSSLVRLDLASNNFTGTINSLIGSYLPNLETFDVSVNNITGRIPSSLSRCKKLELLDLSSNALSGVIPNTLGGCVALKYLYLSKNSLMGTIPPQLAVRGGLLEEVWLYENMLSGTIPNSFAELEDLRYFYIDGNKLTGTVPTELCSENLNSDFFDEADLENLDGIDYCDSVACPIGYVSSEGMYPCEPCSENEISPYLGHRNTCFDSDDTTILKEFWTATSGSEWTGKVDNPWTSNSKCDFTGVTCDLNDDVVNISLSGMGLKGSLPSSIGFLPKLVSLNVSDNSLSGFLPSDLRWPPLEKLDISGNQIKGVVPPQLCFEEGINGNGHDGKYSCRNIACPIGTYSENGLGAPLSLSLFIDSSHQCHHCSDSEYLGAKICTANDTASFLTESITSGPLPKEAVFSVFLMAIFSLFACIYVSYLRIRDNNLKQRNEDALRLQDENEEWRVEDYDNELKTLRKNIANKNVALQQQVASELELDEYFDDPAPTKTHEIS